VKLSHLFGRDVRNALNASWKRRVVSYAPLSIVFIAGILGGDRVPWWVWPAVVFADLIVFAFVGSHWANQDATAAEREATRA
jgi:hypothetical protein